MLKKHSLRAFNRCYRRPERIQRALLGEGRKTRIKRQTQQRLCFDDVSTLTQKVCGVFVKYGLAGRSIRYAGRGEIAEGEGREVRNQFAKGFEGLVHIDHNKPA